MINYTSLMDRLLELPACVLFPTGRTGSDFFQSLLDSHPEVLTFNGHLRFHHYFWEQSVCVSSGSFEAIDVIDEFIGKHIEKLKSKYDLMERKHQLGEDLDQSIDIDLDTFRSDAVKLLGDREINSRTVLLAINGAYALGLGQDLELKKLFFHHAHGFLDLPFYLKDFPQSKIICMTRDPRASFVSGVEHHRDRTLVVDLDDGRWLTHTLTRVLEDATPVGPYSKDYKVIRLEDLGREEILRALCEWLKISFSESLTKSTFGGLRWHSDRLSKVNREAGFSKEMLENQWEKRLSFTDKYVMNYLMNPRLKHYGYSHNKVGIFEALVVPFLIVLPLFQERRFITPRYIRDFSIRNRQSKALTVARNFLNYLRRVRVCFKSYRSVVGKTGFDQPLLTANSAISQDPSPDRS